MCSLCRLPVAKNHSFGPILTFLGLLYRPPFTDEGQIWCAIADPRYTCTCQISSRSSQFVPFFGFRHLVVSPVGANLSKLNTGAQLQIFPYPTASKLFLYSNAVMVKSGAQSLTFKSVTDRQTDKQTENSTFLATPASGEIRAPPNLA